MNIIFLQSYANSREANAVYTNDCVSFVYFNNFQFQKQKNVFYVRKSLNEDDFQIVLELILLNLGLQHDNLFTPEFYGSIWISYTFPELNKEILTFLNLQHPLIIEI